jgi:hypothetical protein
MIRRIEDLREGMHLFQDKDKGGWEVIPTKPTNQRSGSTHRPVVVASLPLQHEI